VIDALKARLDVRLDDPLIVWALRGFEWRLRRADPRKRPEIDSFERERAAS